MGFLDTLLSPREVRDEVITTSAGLDEYLKRRGLGPTHAGISVNHESAMSQVTVFACVRIIAESIAMLPLHVNRIVERDARRIRERADNLDIYGLLHDQPNDWQTSGEFREMMQGHAALRGNAYAFINRLGSGRVAELIPLHPDRVSVEQLSNYAIEYTYTLPKGGQKKYRRDQIFHLKGLSSDGVVGLSPVTLARQVIGLALAIERHGATTFGKGARPGGVLEHPKSLSAEARKRLEDSLAADYGGDNSGRNMVLEEGMTWSQVGLSNEDAQFVDSAKLQRSQIAQMFRVPGHMVGDLDRSIQSNIEQQARDLVTYTLMPWIVRWEEALYMSLLKNIESGRVRAKFALQGLLRGDSKARGEFYAKGIQWGWFNRNEVREFEDLNPEEGLDKFLSPENMREGPSDESEE